MIVINFKTYSKATGEKGVSLARICEEVARETGVKIIIGVQSADIFHIASQVKIPIFGQHIDPKEPERNTGWITALSLKEAGAKGVFLNHSEHFYNSFEELEQGVQFAKDNGLETLIFAKDLETAKRIDQLNPNYLALEEPTLVAKQAMAGIPSFKKILLDFSKAIKSFPIVGAGVRTKEDVEESLNLGMKGIAFSSEFMNSENPKELLLSFASCFL